jgi:serine acetyltransferase
LFVTPDVIGRDCTLTDHVTIDHSFDDATGARVLGGGAALIAIGSNVFARVHIGHDVVISANAVQVPRASCASGRRVPADARSEV